MAAAAGVHRRDELEAGRIGDVMVGPRDHRLAGLDRLAQGIQHRARKFGQLVQEQHAAMGKRHFPGLARMPPPTRAGAELEWCGSRNGRLRSIRPSFRMPATDRIIETSSASAGVSGGSRPGRRAAIIDLPAPAGRP